jgi:hypothetical protein
VVIGLLFTVAGIASLMIPGLPFICLGALVFGPIELLIGLFGEAPLRRRPQPPPVMAVGASETAWMKRCGSCGMPSDPAAAFCANCGFEFP